MGPTMPAPRSQMARGYNSANGKIYLVGGYETAFIDSVSGQTWEFDPAAGTFTEKAPSPQIQGGTASGIVNGHLIMAGGRTNPDATLDLAWDYNIATDSWTQLSEHAGRRERPRQRRCPRPSLVDRRRRALRGPVHDDRRRQLRPGRQRLVIGAGPERAALLHRSLARREHDRRSRRP